MKQLVIASSIALVIGVLIAGCGEVVGTDSAASIQRLDRQFVPTDAQRQSMLDALAERERILSEYGESRPVFVMTDAQRQSMLDAIAEQDRVLSGYADPARGIAVAQQPITQFVLTDTQKQSMLEAIAERDRILMGY